MYRLIAAAVALVGFLFVIQLGHQTPIAVPLESPAHVMAVHRKSNLLAIGDLSGRALIWDLKDKKALGVFDRTKNGVDSLAFSPDGKNLAIASDDDVVYEYSGGAATIITQETKKSGIRAGRIFDIETGKEQGALKCSESLRCLRFDPSGKWLVGTSFSNVEIWEAETGKHLHTYKGFLFAGHVGIAFHPDGKSIAVAGYDGDVLFLAIPDFKALGKIQVEKGIVYAVAFLEQGKKCVCGGREGTLTLFDTETKKQLTSLTGFGWITSLAVLNHQGLVVVGEERQDSAPFQGRVVLVDLEAKKETVIFAPNTLVRAVELLDDSARFAIGCSDTNGVIFAKYAK